MFLAEIPGCNNGTPTCLENCLQYLLPSNLDGVEDGFKKSRRYAQFGWSWTYSCYSHEDPNPIWYSHEGLPCLGNIHQPKVVSVISTTTWFHHWLLVVDHTVITQCHNNVSSFDPLNVKTLSKRRNNMQCFASHQNLLRKFNNLLASHWCRARCWFVTRYGSVWLCRLVNANWNLTADRPACFLRCWAKPHLLILVYKGLGTLCRLPTRCYHRSWWWFRNGCCYMWMFFEHPDVSFFGAKQKFFGYS